MRLSSNSLVSFLGFPQFQLLIACICKLEAIKNGKPSKSGGRYLRFGGGGGGVTDDGACISIHKLGAAIFVP